ncbi:hypothetical protein NQ317_000275 [Molorchus minor]|uniref:2,3-bisphosphoglycerate 3-phosphatase n=1 Tax=Molorchus minor TaxID=1323400 RepID=A0ABQ9JCB1_9CUCU|nr:hypothetical protein NQ317_000275 [Molorchus minor]
MATHLVFLTICIFIDLSSQCSITGYPFENHLSSETPYRLVSNKSFYRIQYDGCTPKKIWMVIRHGTRNPSISKIEQINNRLPDIRDFILENDNLPNGFIKNRDLDLFQKWEPTLNAESKKKLTREGREEMLLLAERMQSKFPELFDNIYSNTSFKFKYTHTQRTKKSALYFVTGLFGKNNAKSVWFPEPLKNDPILRFYKSCTKWYKEVKDDPKLKRINKAFEQSAEMLKTLKVINERLNFSRVSSNLSADDVFLMYKTCAYETAWNKQSKSPWCSPFTEEELKVLEYAEDLELYWQDGYGHELTYKQACPAFSDMINMLISNETYPKVTAYFTHSGTILKMLAHLGLYKDSENLTATNYGKMANRKWRTSFIDSFGSNLAFISFKCNKNNKILTLHQEKVVRLPSCPNSDLCDIKEVISYYSESIEHCDLTSMCAI